MRPTVADFSMMADLSYPQDEPGYDLANSDPAVNAWLLRIAALPGWRAPYELLPGQRLVHYAYTRRFDTRVTLHQPRLMFLPSLAK